MRALGSRRFLLAPLAAAAALAVVACAEETPPPVVPGPTTATPADLRPAPPPPVVPAGPTRGAIRTPDAPVVAFRIGFAAGSADDPAGKEGLTRLTATMMAEGGTQSMTYAELAEKLYPMAASIDVEVDRDETVFVATVPKAEAASFFPLLRDVLLTPRFDDESFTRLRTRQTSELVSELRGASDEELGKETLQWMLYEGHPYGHPTEGTEHGLAAITAADVRAQYAQAFCRDRVTVGVAGAYPEGFDEAVLAEMAKLPACAGERAKLPDPPARHGLELVVVDKPGASGTAISIGFPTPVTRSDVAEFPGLAFATDALGLHRQFSGRLFQELREKRGLNYGDYAYAEFFEQDGWGRTARPNVARREQFVSIWLRPVKRVNSTFALRAALYVYGKLVTEGLSPEQFARTRDFLTRIIGLDQQTESRQLGYAMDDRTYGLTKPYVETMRQGWADLDPDKLKALMAKTLDTKNLAIAIVASKGQEIADELLKGTPSATPPYDAPKPAEIQAEDRVIAALPLPFDAKAVRVVPVSDLFK